MTLEHKINWSDVKHKYDSPLAFYEQHYSGVTRGVLRYQNFGLYMKLRRDGILAQVPTIKPVESIEDPLKIYHRDYTGMTRSELKKANPALYVRMWRHDVLQEVPLKLGV
jgi:hypothetical protein